MLARVILPRVVREPVNEGLLPEVEKVMMAASNSAARSKQPRVVGTTLELAFGEVWQDALDPELPADPTLGVRHADSSLLGGRPRAHKLILVGLALGAGLQALGYFGASYLF